MIHMRNVTRTELTQQLIKKMAPPLGESGSHNCLRLYSSHAHVRRQ